jgi:hypothetical protein
MQGGGRTGIPSQTWKGGGSGRGVKFLSDLGSNMAQNCHLNSKFGFNDVEKPLLKRKGPHKPLQIMMFFNSITQWTNTVASALIHALAIDKTQLPASVRAKTLVSKSSAMATCHDTYLVNCSQSQMAKVAIAQRCMTC